MCVLEPLAESTNFAPSTFPLTSIEEPVIDVNAPVVFPLPIFPEVGFMTTAPVIVTPLLSVANLLLNVAELAPTNPA